MKRRVYAICIDLGDGEAQFVAHSFAESFQDACDLFAKTKSAEIWVNDHGPYSSDPPSFGGHPLVNGGE